MQLESTHNAAKLFFDQASRQELKDKPRFMIPLPDGGWRPMSWSELSTRVQHLASFLIDRGVNKGVNVGILANTRVEWGIAALALMASRGSLVPAYPTLTPELIAHVVGHSDSEVLFVENADQLRRVLAVWSHLKIKTLVTIEPEIDVHHLARQVGLDPAQVASVTFPLAQAEELGASELAAEPDRVLKRTDEIELSDVAYLVYTSGTTGLPKGVPLTHHNVGSSGADWIECNGSLVHEGDVDLLWLPMSHLYGMGELFLGNQVGFVTYLSDPLKALMHLPEVRPHVFMSVPAYWEKMMQLAQTDAQSEEEQHAKLRAITGGRLSFCLSGGAGLAREVKDFFLGAGTLIIEGYGLTEASPNLTFNRHDDFDFDTVGKPVPSVEIRLAGDGEILAKGPNIFSGYFKDPQATAEVLDSDGWLHTGDLGRFTAAGFLQIVGRKKEIIVTSGGKNIPPANIELRFKDDPLIAQLMVYGDGKKYLTALVDIDEAVARARLAAIGEEPIDAPSSSVRNHPEVRSWVQERVEEVNAQLARYETIKSFTIASEPLTVEADLLTPTLKLKRAKIIERYGRELDALYG